MLAMPKVGDKGRYKFAEPFNTLLKEQQTFTVTTITTLKALKDNGSKPLENIYKLVGLTEQEYNEDVANDVPIIEFNSGANYYHIPGNRILSMPDITGVLYSKKVVSIPLGDLPNDMNLTVLLTNLKDIVYDTLGVTSTPVVTKISADIAVSKDEDLAFRTLLNSKKSVINSWQAKYLKAEQELIQLKKTIQDLEQAVLISTNEVSN